MSPLALRVPLLSARVELRARRFVGEQATRELHSSPLMPTPSETVDTQKRALCRRRPSVLHGNKVVRSGKMSSTEFRRKFGAAKYDSPSDEQVFWRAYVHDRTEDFYFCYYSEDETPLATSWRDPDGEITEAAQKQGAVEGPYLRYDAFCIPLPQSRPLYSRADGSSFVI